MTKEEIIEMAYQTKLPYGYVGGKLMWLDKLEHFAQLIAKKEREACNAICLDTYEWAENLLDQDEKHFAGRMRAAQDIGNAIRARGQE